jgi:NADP-dependent alcohol dehydrogenase
MNLLRDQKKEKIMQYGERVWGISKGNETDRIDQTISKTIEFFESVGIKTKLPDYSVPTETITIIEDRFKQRGFKLGEKANIGPEEIRQILENRL